MNWLRWCKPHLVFYDSFQQFSKCSSWTSLVWAETKVLWCGCLEVCPRNENRPVLRLSRSGKSLIEGGALSLLHFNEAKYHYIVNVIVPRPFFC